MGFRLVPNLVTLNNLERRNSPQVCVISPNSVDFRVDYVKEAEATPILSATKMKLKECSFSDISLMAIMAGDHPQRER